MKALLNAAGAVNASAKNKDGFIAHLTGNKNARVSITQYAHAIAGSYGMDQSGGSLRNLFNDWAQTAEYIKKLDEARNSELGAWGIKDWPKKFAQEIGATDAEVAQIKAHGQWSYFGTGVHEYIEAIIKELYGDNLTEKAREQILAAATGREKLFSTIPEELSD